MDVAEVKIWGEFVGAVAWDDQKGYASFEYSPDFIEKGRELSPIKMPINSGQRLFSFPELRKSRDSQYDTFKGLPGLLADALPDKYGSDLINVWLARQGRPQDSMNPVELLCFMGERGMGALEFEPGVINKAKQTTAIEINSLVEVAHQILNKRESFRTNLSADEENAVKQILRVGTSAGGARPKAVIAWNEKTDEVRSGQGRVPKNYEHWMMKLDGVSDIQVGKTLGYGRVEMAYYNMALDCEIKMMPSRLFLENGRAHFMTKRFDRGGDGIKHHTQTFCAIRHFDYNLVTSFSYEQLFQTMRELRLSYAEAEQMFRRMVFNVIARNCDDHTKNFSFILKKDEDWALAPAYDLCHAYRPDSPWVSQHALSINGKRTGINRSDLLKIGESISCKKAGKIIEDINSIVNQWPDYAREVEVEPSLRDEIGETIIDLA